MMICSPCVLVLAATKRVLSFNGQPEIIYVYVSYMEYGRTHKHSLKRARQTHDKIKNNQALPAYSNKPHKKGGELQVWLDQAVSCLQKGSSYIHEDSFKQVDPAKTETAVGDATSMSYSGLGGTSHWLSRTQNDYCRCRRRGGSVWGS